ncbi:MAG: ArsR/SmtB family transcription factor [Bryobacteraceae bacterium]
MTSFSGFCNTERGNGLSTGREATIPERALIAKELAELLGAIAHPHRLRILVELHHGEMDVNSLQQILGISHSSVSQNLAILRAHHLVRERRQGRHVYYSLSEPAFADWLLAGLRFLETGLARHQEEIRSAAEAARRMWMKPAGSS